MKSPTFSKKMFNNYMTYLESHMLASVIDNMIFEFFCESFTILKEFSVAGYDDLPKSLVKDYKSILINKLYSETSLTMTEIASRLSMSKELVVYHISKYKKLSSVKDAKFAKAREIFDKSTEDMYQFLLLEITKTRY